MSWVEVDGAGSRWVHGLVIPKMNSFLVTLEFDHVLQTILLPYL